MIALLRKIRQKLLVSGRFTKYLLYAIGEIILVVIGILIALQINNWNEERKAIVREIQILKQLKSDLESNKEEIEKFRLFTERRANASKTILDYLENKREFDENLKSSFELMTKDLIFNSANTTYKYIENQGIDFLQNDSLRISITEMYDDRIQNMYWRTDYYWSLVQSDLNPLMDVLFKSAKATREYIPGVYLEINTPLNMRELHENSQFKNVIVRMQTILVGRLSWQDLTLIELNELIDDIEEELKVLK